MAPGENGQCGCVMWHLHCESLAAGHVSSALSVHAMRCTSVLALCHCRPVPLHCFSLFAVEGQVTDSDRPGVAPGAPGRAWWILGKPSPHPIT